MKVQEHHSSWCQRQRDESCHWPVLSFCLFWIMRKHCYLLCSSNCTVLCEFSCSLYLHSIRLSFIMPSPPGPVPLVSLDSAFTPNKFRIQHCGHKINFLVLIFLKQKKELLRSTHQRRSLFSHFGLLTFRWFLKMTCKVSTAHNTLP